MAGFRGGHRGFNRIEIPHLAEQDDIGSLPEGSHQSIYITVRIQSNLTLGDNGTVMPVQIFNRILQSNNVAVSRPVYFIDNTCQSGGFSAACGSGDKDKPFFQVCRPDDFRRDVHIFRSGYLKVNNTDDGGQGASLFHDTHAESGDSFNRTGKIVIPVGMQLIHTSVVAELIKRSDQSLRIGGHQFIIVDWNNLTIYFIGERKAGDYKNV